MMIDLNCDVGEGVGNEASLMPYISSCNIACGAHAGDVATIDRVIQIAEAHEVKIGAHPSFPDRANFGRKMMKISAHELKASIVEQLKLLQERLRGRKMHHVKMHGALYNVSVTDQGIAEVVVEAVQEVAAGTTLYVPDQSIVATLAKEAGLTVCYEVFADRNYLDDLRLVPRSQPNAVLHDQEVVGAHVLRMIQEQKVQTLTGNLLPIKAETCCVHGDNEAAIDLVKCLYQLLKQNGIAIA